MGTSGRTLLVALLALLVSPDVLGFALYPASARHRAGSRRVPGGRGGAAANSVRMQAGDPRYDSLVNRVEAASKIPTPTREQQNAALIPAIRSQDADTPVTVAEVEKQVASKKSEVVTEKRPAAPLTPAGGGGSGQAYDGAVSTGSAALQVVEGLAVLAIVPAVLAALGKQKATKERKQKNQARAEELARGRQARADAKVAAVEQAAIDRKEKQEGIAARIEASRSGEWGGGSSWCWWC
eukprot:jgi/Undpi1/9623/HiC_scaffold_27.g12079.m1